MIEKRQNPYINGAVTSEPVEERLNEVKLAQIEAMFEEGILGGDTGLKFDLDSLSCGFDID